MLGSVLQCRGRLWVAVKVNVKFNVRLFGYYWLYVELSLLTSWVATYTLIQHQIILYTYAWQTCTQSKVSLVIFENFHFKIVCLLIPQTFLRLFIIRGENHHSVLEEELVTGLCTKQTKDLINCAWNDAKIQQEKTWVREHSLCVMSDCTCTADTSLLFWWLALKRGYLRTLRILLKTSD